MNGDKLALVLFLAVVLALTGIIGASAYSYYPSYGYYNTYYNTYYSGAYRYSYSYYWRYQPMPYYYGPHFVAGWYAPRYYYYHYYYPVRYYYPVYYSYTYWYAPAPCGYWSGCW